MASGQASVYSTVGVEEEQLLRSLGAGRSPSQLYKGSDIILSPSQLYNKGSDTHFEKVPLDHLNFLLFWTGDALEEGDVWIGGQFNPQLMEFKGNQISALLDLRNQESALLVSTIIVCFVSSMMSHKVGWG